uniref:Uncharacterized protein n=1 Tax=Schlesneria paludicola TaxID=360056 RepID=A0A7C4LMD1_9PLAN
MKSIIYPYPTLRGGIELKVTEVRADGNCVSLEPPYASESAIDVQQLIGNQWKELTIDFDVRSQPQGLQSFEKEHGHVTLTVVASCRPTNVRQSAAPTRSKLDHAVWSGRMAIQRQSFREKIRLRAIATGQHGGVANRPIGFSNEITLHLDPTNSFRVAGALPVVWCDFQSSEAPPLAKQFQDAPYVVNLEKPLPEILLNAAFEGLEPLLRDSKDRTKIEQALHDSTRMSIARSVWMTLLGTAMSGIRCDDPDEDPEWPDSDWQAEILKRILPEIDPTRSDSELLRLAASEWRQYPGSATFLSRAEAVIGDLIQANKSLRKTIQTLNREGIVA